MFVQYEQKRKRLKTNLQCAHAAIVGEEIVAVVVKRRARERLPVLLLLRKYGIF
jgi:hypothetical protein